MAGPFDTRLLPAGLRGYVLGDVLGQQRAANNIGQVSGILGLQHALRQQAMEEQFAPLKLQLMQAQVDSALNPAPTKVDLGGSFGLMDRSGNIVAQIPKTATPDAVLKERGASERHLTPSGSALLQEQGAMRRHEVPGGAALLNAQVQREGHGVTVRGQNMTDARARDANQIEAGKRIDTDTTNLRKEFNDVPEVKKYRTVQPILQSAYNAPNTAAGDLDLVYAVGKILDPESVVREGELNLTIKAGSPMERFKGQVQHIMSGKGRMTAQTRAELTAMLEGRVGELRRGYDSAKTLYSTAAQRRGLDASQIFMDDTYGRRDTDRRPAVGAVIDGYRFKGGDPGDRKNWERI